MNRFREHLSAWVVVGLLATALVAVWGGDRSVVAEATVCRDAGKVAGLVLPGAGTGWRPDPVLAGLPRPERGPAAYEISEARSLERLGVAAVPDFAARRGAGATALC